MFEKKVSQKDLISIMKKMNRDVSFYGYGIEPLCFVDDYDEEPISCKQYFELLELFYLLLEYLNLEVEEKQTVKRIIKKQK